MYSILYHFTLYNKLSLGRSKRSSCGTRTVSYSHGHPTQVLAEGDGLLDYRPRMVISAGWAVLRQASTDYKDRATLYDIKVGDLIIPVEIADTQAP